MRNQKAALEAKAILLKSDIGTEVRDNIFSQGKATEGSIVSYIRKDDLHGDNQKFAKLYDRIAPFYNISQKLFYKMT
ncbi:MAG: hypothetical protein LBI64_04325, partial [Coriobacteriales bacterium]|nr:hypothetical protein [Coriobacteriales bacterium]